MYRSSMHARRDAHKTNEKTTMEIQIQKPQDYRDAKATPERTGIGQRFRDDRHLAAT
jgi:hypothetical protein